MSYTKSLLFKTAITLGIVGMCCAAASAQRAPQAKEGASIVVDGIVREVFRSPRQTQVDFVIQVEVSSLSRYLTLAPAARSRFRCTSRRLAP